MKKFVRVAISVLSIKMHLFSQSIQAPEKPYPKIQNWEQIVQKATKENKNILVDLSTEWCVACKVVEKKQFTDPEIRSLMDSKLHTYMLDAEKDSIGQLIKLKYGICAYPSFVIFSPKGEYIETWYGAMPNEYWIQYVKDSIDKEPLLRPGIPEGLHFKWPQFIERELKANFRNSAPGKEELQNHFRKNNYKNFIDFSICRMYPGDIPDTMVDKMVQDQHWLATNYGSDLTTDMLSTSINWKVYAQIQKKEWAQARKYMQQYVTNFPQFKWELFNAKLYYYQSKMELDSMIRLGQENPEFVFEFVASQIVAHVCEYGQIEEHFQQALKWNSEELEKEITYTLAKHQAILYQKIQSKKEARQWAKKAIAIAQQENITLSENDKKSLLQIAEDKTKKPKKD